jgi:hypothetical protein
MNMGSLTEQERAAILVACRRTDPVPAECFPALRMAGFVDEHRMPTDVAYVALWNDHKCLHLTLAARRWNREAQSQGHFEEI